MKFADLQNYKPKPNQNVFVFVCEDAFLVEESKEIWLRIFGGNWTFERYQAKEFEEIPANRLMDDALTQPLFSWRRALLLSNSEKLTKGRVEELSALAVIPNSSLKIVLATASRKSMDSLSGVFPVVEIDAMKPAEVSRWLSERYTLEPNIARYLVEQIGTDLYQLHGEVEKLKTYVGDGRRIDVRDIDIIILRSEQFGPFELDDALLARDYRKAVLVVGSMLEDGVDPLRVLAQITRVWRQLFVGKGLVGKMSPKDVALAAAFPAWKAADLATSCRKFGWKQLAEGFIELLQADRAFKSSSPNTEAYFDVMLWKLIASG